MLEDPSRPVVVIIDDDEDFGDLLALWLESGDYETRLCTRGEVGLEVLSTTLVDVVCLDLQMPGIDGLETLERILKRNRDLPVLMMTSSVAVDNAVEAMRLGAYDYLTKPLDEDKFLTTVRNAVNHHQMLLRLQELETESTLSPIPGMVGQSPPMKRLYREIKRVAASDITVLVHGESGTGKELITRALHQGSGRCDGPLIALNCAAIPESLMESELFGHERGAFTGATGRHCGKFEQADGGTLFLDEVAELPPHLQVKLLRVLQERTFTRVGGVEEIRSDFRLVAATHRDLLEEVEAGRFREDLFFRIAVFELEVPPLRLRGDDVLLLAEHFVSVFSESPCTLSREVVEVLMNYTWRGNVRELQNAIQRALAVCNNGRIQAQDLPPRIWGSVSKSLDFEVETPAQSRQMQDTTVVVESSNGLPVVTLEALEQMAIEQSLARHEGSLKDVVAELGIGRTTLYRKLKKYGIK